MIQIDNLKIPTNYVLVKPEDDFKTYQMNGRETDIAVTGAAGTAAQHFAVSGIVHKVPSRLISNGDDIFNLQQLNSNCVSVEKRIQELRAESMMYDVDIEVKPGDYVVFGYQQYFDCHKNGRVIETEYGDMLLVRYDELVLSYKPGNKKDFYPLNGFVVVEPVEIPHVIEDGVMFYLNPNSSIKVPLMEPTPYLKSTRARRRFQVGRIDRIGSLVRGYRDFPGVGDDTRKLSVGQIVIYNQAYAVNLEYDLHRTLSEKKLYRFNRKDILLVIEDSMEFDINSIISNFVNN